MRSSIRDFAPLAAALLLLAALGAVLFALVPVRTGATPLALDRAAATDIVPDDLEPAQRGPAAYGELPTTATAARTLEKWHKDVATWLYDTQELTLQEHKATGLHYTPGEAEAAFRVRVAEAQREQGPTYLQYEQQCPRLVGREGRR